MNRKLFFTAATTMAMTTAVQAQAQERPNIILILADDLGYSDIGCYGGEIETPNIDRLAANGLRYRQFYNGARSCPTRASLLTGLYAHQAGMGWMVQADMGRPSYQGYLNQECVTLGDVLRSAGYGTYICGKWHVSSARQNGGKIKDNWPNQRGFDEFFGIVDGASSYFNATLNRNNEQFNSSGEDFYLTHAFSESASDFIRNHNFDEKPLFLYMAYTAPHWPLHALKPDIDKYIERYRRGWDVLREERFARQKQMGLFSEDTQLAPRDRQVPAWDTLSPEKQEEFAMRMAVYAAQVDAMDQGIGRIMEALEQQGQTDNTIVLFLSDNGACAEHIGNSRHVDGSDNTYESYRRNWANLSSTPYKEYKHHTNEGGIATPLIVHYPRGVKEKLNGTFVSEYGHITDIMPTFVELSGAQYPVTFKGHHITPMQGVSLLPNFVGGKTDREQTFWEHEANIAVRDGRWKILTKTLEGSPYQEDSIRLYDMKKDPTEMHDLAAKKPRLKARLYADWNRWADKVGALPLDTRSYGRRRNDYNRAKPNDEFDENFGGWDCHQNGGAELDFEIDTIRTISGEKTARIIINKSGVRPANGWLKWSFRAEKDERLTISFKACSSQPTELKFRLEDPGRINDKAINESVELNSEVQSFSFTSKPLFRSGEYQLVFYMGLSQGEIWIDSVTISSE